MKQKWVVRKERSRFVHPDKDKSAESLLFGTAPSLARSFASRIFSSHKKIDTSWLAPSAIPFRSSKPIITWIGHATFLIQLGEINILTDPIFGQVSPFFPRLLDPGLQLDTLPSIDYVLISHNHWDHFDKPTLKAIKKKNPHVQLYVPLGDRAWFAKHRFFVQEFSWWQKESGPVEFTFLPADHWSGRGLFDRNKSLWGSWMISHKDMHIYFAGDTAYSDHFLEIADKYSTIDTALLPIAPGLPQNWMLRTHMDAQYALRAFDDLNARCFIPMHWGSFPFGAEPQMLQINQLQQRWATEKQIEKKLQILKLGESFNLK